MSFHEIKITSDEKSTAKHVFIDGVEQKGIVACDICLRPKELPTVRLEYIATNLTINFPKANVDPTVLHDVHSDGFIALVIEHLELSGRAYNVLKHGNWDTYLNRDDNRCIADVMLAYYNGHLKKYLGMGKKTYEEVVTQLKRFGLIGGDEK